MKIIIEEEWEADDIVKYCKDNKIEYEVLPQKDIQCIDCSKFMIMTFFCNTLIIQKNLKALGLSCLIPDTYSEIFNNFYKRKITKFLYKELQNCNYPYFLKSSSNDKSIDGTIITDSNDLINLWITNNVLPTPDLELYVCEVVHFDVEYRLLIGNNKLYGKGYQKGDKTIEISTEFLNNLLKTSNDYFFCIDVGFMKEKKEWAIVEINPPFSLDDYDIPIDDYINYNISFWKTIPNQFQINLCKTIIN